MFNTQTLEVSPFFLSLFDLYHAELESLSRKCEEESAEILEKAVRERRANCQEYLTLFMNDSLESAAVMFHGTIDFRTGPESEVLQALVACESRLELPDYSSILAEIDIDSAGNHVLHHAQARSGGHEFALVAIGLEFLRTFGWSAADHPVAPAEPSDNEDEGEWRPDEAPQLLGLDTVVIEG